MTKRTFLIAVATIGAVITGLIVFAVLSFPDWFWHPLDTGTGSTCSATNHTGCGYASWSGGFSDIGEITIIGGMITTVLMMWRHFNCHADGCYRLTWHVHDDHGHPVCKVHHPHGGNRPHTIGGKDLTTDDGSVLG